MYIHVHISACIYMYLYLYAHLYTLFLTHTHIHKFTYMNVYIYIHIYICKCIGLYVNLTHMNVCCTPLKYVAFALFTLWMSQFYIAKQPCNHSKEPCLSVTRSRRHASRRVLCVSWLIPTCDMTHSLCDINGFHVRHYWFPCATWLIPMCDMTHSHVRHDSFPCATWLIPVCDSTHSNVRHDSRTVDGMWDVLLEYHVAYGNGSCRTWEWVMSHMEMGHVAHWNEYCRTWEWVTYSW